MPHQPTLLTCRVATALLALPLLVAAAKADTNNYNRATFSCNTAVRLPLGHSEDIQIFIRNPF